MTAVDRLGNTTTYAYDSAGDLRQVIDPVGLKTTTTYDEIGRTLTRTVYDGSALVSALTTYTYDQVGDILTQTDPATTNSVTGVVHQRQISNTYDANRNLVDVAASDLTGGDTARRTSFTYDADDRETSSTDPAGGTTSRHFNIDGQIDQVTDADGRTLVTAYDVAGRPVRVTAKAFVDDPSVPTPARDLIVGQTTYDAAGRRATQTDSLGRVQQFAYDRADRLISTTLVGFHNRDGTTQDVVLSSATYDAAGHSLTETTGGGETTVVNVWDAAGRLVSTTLDPSGLKRTLTFSYDAAGNALSRMLSDASRSETTIYTYDAGNRPTSESVQMGGGLSLTTTFVCDQRGNLTAQIDPRGNLPGADPAAFETLFTHDSLNRQVMQADPVVAVQQNGQAPTSVARLTLTGYDTFGNVTQTRDRRGNLTTAAYDKLDRRISVTQPQYSTPAGVTISAVELY